MLGESLTKLLCAESTSSATAMSNPRLLVIMGDSSSLELVEEFAPGPGNGTKYFTNSVTEVQLDEGAQLNHGSALPVTPHYAPCCGCHSHGQQLLVMYGCKVQSSHLVCRLLCNSCNGRQQVCNSSCFQHSCSHQSVQSLSIWWVEAGGSGSKVKRELWVTVNL